MFRQILKTVITNQRMKASGRMTAEEEKKFPSLSKSEWNEVKDIWDIRMDGRRLKLYQKGYRLFKGLCGEENFSPLYCPNILFEPYILRSLNLPVHVLGLERKDMYDTLFPNIPKPKTVFKCIGGIFFDSQMNIISIDDALRLLHNHETVCVKPTFFSACGNGVRCLDCKNLTHEQFTEFFSSYGENYIVQEVLKQSVKTSMLSKKSLNTFRVSTLFINGKCSICTIINRIGREDSFVDNGFAGNYCVGVNEDGTYQPQAYDVKYKTYSQTDTGIRYEGFRLEEIKELVEIVKKTHTRCLPHCGFCGWDFALDTNNEWNLIEVNLYAPGIEMEQICPGKPLFGDRTREVIEYVNNHQPSLLAILTSLGYM